MSYFYVFTFLSWSERILLNLSPVLPSAFLPPLHWRYQCNSLLVSPCAFLQPHLCSDVSPARNAIPGHTIFFPKTWPAMSDLLWSLHRAYTYLLIQPFTDSLMSTIIFQALWSVEEISQDRPFPHEPHLLSWPWSCSAHLCISRTCNVAPKERSGHGVMRQADWVAVQLCCLDFGEFLNLPVLPCLHLHNGDDNYCLVGWFWILSKCI